MPFSYRCDRCGAPVQRHCRATSDRVYCSFACRVESQRIHPATVTCEVCGVTFTRTFAMAANRRFCSRACYRENLSPARRFWPSVEKSAGCWLWTGLMARDGRYGRFRVRRNGVLLEIAAHRVAWELTHGLIPPSMNVCHRCDVPLCVRPDHLFLGTQAENMADMARKGRAATGDNTGPRRHPERVRRGEAHPFARLDAARVKAIRADYASGHRPATVMLRHGLRHSTFWNIIRRRTWKHV